MIQLENANGMRAEILTLGGIVQSLLVPDRAGRLADVVLGHDGPDASVAKGACPAAIIGRCANRIGGAKFVTGGKTWPLEANNHGNCLHSGRGNYAHRVFEVMHADSQRLRLCLEDAGGPEWGGFPGKVGLMLEYELGHDNRLSLQFWAEASHDTVFNVTSHAYFNLGGHDSGSICDHELQVESDFYTVADKTCLPTGEVRSVAGGALDFRQARDLGGALDELERQGCPFGGLDHNLALRGRGLRRVATLRHPDSGRVMDVLTSLPGLQLYSANHLGQTLGKGGAVYGKHQAICLETQHFPDAVNQSHFPDPMLYVGRILSHRTEFAFRLG